MNTVFAQTSLRRVGNRLSLNSEALPARRNIRLHICLPRFCDVPMYVSTGFFFLLLVIIVKMIHSSNNLCYLFTQ